MLIFEHPTIAGLVNIEAKMKRTRALWLDADFEGKPEARQLEREYLRLREALSRGCNWEPDF